MGHPLQRLRHHLGLDEAARFETATIGYLDTWYFPKGVPHTVQGVEDENEFLLVLEPPDPSPHPHHPLDIGRARREGRLGVSEKHVLGA